MAEKMKTNETGISNVPMVALKDVCILPNTVIHFEIRKAHSLRAIEEAMKNNQIIFISTLLFGGSASKSEEPEVHDIGVIAEIRQVSRLPEQQVRILVYARNRARLISQKTKEGYYEACVQELPSEIMEDEIQNEAMLRQGNELFAQYVKCGPKISKNVIQKSNEIKQIGEFMDFVVVNIPVGVLQKQLILEAEELIDRFTFFQDILQTEIEVYKVKEEFVQEVKSKVEKNQKEYVLREQLMYIQKELGDDTTLTDAEEWEKQLQELNAKESVKKRIAKEIKRFKGISSNSSESTVLRGYIETLLEMPWDKSSDDNLNMLKAKERLEKDHYGLEQVKERILEFLAVGCFADKGESPILCLVGPPGTGKTSIAKSIAKSLDKKYARICLGGVRDEAEIRGHRRTYVGAMPGRIVSAVKQAGVKNPLLLLDEIDKVSNDHKGDTFSALLEVLDSEQNSKFRDHYLELPLDLSEVFFICTANSTSTIPKPLLDRMEVIEVTSYTENEKFHIAKDFLMKKQFRKNGMTGKMLSISDSALRIIISSYTREAGVRGLERKIGEVCRKTAKRLMEQIMAEEEDEFDEFKEWEKIKVNATNLKDFLGKPKYNIKKANEKNEVGIARGLAWTSVGGDTLQIEVNRMPGKGKINLTGQMGDVMKESAQAAFTYVRSIGEKYHIKPSLFQENDFHIHIPEGAVPKDGPSAGITMATAILSVAAEIPVKADIAMTGEVTLRGRVLPVGGLKEKILAAKMADIKTVIVPKKNENDILEISEEIKGGLHIIYVDNMQAVLKEALAK